jgi:hypothetical protein
VSTLADRGKGAEASALAAMPPGLARVAAAATLKVRSARDRCGAALAGAMGDADPGLVAAMASVHQAPLPEAGSGERKPCTIFEPHLDKAPGRVATLYAVLGLGFVQVNVPAHHPVTLREARDTQEYEAWKLEAYPGGVCRSIAALEKEVSGVPPCVGSKGGRRRVVALRAGQKLTFTASCMAHGTVVPAVEGEQRTLVIFHALDRHA